MDFIQKGKLSMIVDGQYGSTGKGNASAYMATQPGNEVYVAISNASANAGHWAKFGSGTEYLTHHLPMFGVLQGCRIYLPAGSIINPIKLLEEMARNKVDKRNVFIHPRAAIIKPEHIESERLDDAPATKIASTQQGVAAALAGKITRQQNIAANCEELKEMVSVLDIDQSLKRGAKAIMEVPQGFSLSVDQRFYPYCTSRNCTVPSAMSDLSLHPRYLGNVLMTLRTYPIRVGGIVKDGVEIGNSGPVYPDQKEVSWDELGVDPERTTVTGRKRRVFSFSHHQLIDAARVNMPNWLFLNFMNYLASDTQRIAMAAAVKMTFKDKVGYDANMIYGHGPLIEDISHEPI